jgi:hypothetical protein
MPNDRSSSSLIDLESSRAVVCSAFVRVNLYFGLIDSSLIRVPNQVSC